MTCMHTLYNILVILYTLTLHHEISYPLTLKVLLRSYKLGLCMCMHAGMLDVLGIIKTMTLTADHEIASTEYTSILLVIQVQIM